MPFEALQGQRLLDVQYYEPWGGRVPDRFAPEGPGVSEFLCKRFGLQLTEMRSPN